MKEYPASLKSASTGLLDTSLSAIASMLVVYSLGLSLANTPLAVFCVFVVAVGAVVSLGVQTLLKSQSSLAWDSYLYALGAFAALMLPDRLNAVLPGDGIPPELRIASVLTWMILFGSFATWRDATLLFQAVPCISLFALVGTFSNFEGATFAFFFFLLSMAVLYARSHQREMIQRARLSGYARLEEIRQGPWRWVAGPGWALASATLVVLISFFGAPVVQFSFQGVAGVVRLPRPSVSTPPSSGIGAAGNPTALRVGTGPRLLSDRVVMLAELDRPRYLRSSTYDSYTGTGWSATNWEANEFYFVNQEAYSARRELLRSESFETVPFAVQPLTISFSKLPLPGEVVSLKPEGRWRLHPDGTLEVPAGMPPMVKVTGQTKVLSPQATDRGIPRPTPRFLANYVDTRGIQSDVATLADRVCENIEGSYERALALKAEIERRCVYNLNAEPTPSGPDPVSYFLFEGEREGYCDLFASSMALMARSQGIPARLATGYFPTTGKRDRNGAYEVREADAHAWAELYFEGLGWVPFDPTEGAREVPGGGVGDPTLAAPWMESPWVKAGLALLMLGGASIGGWFVISAVLSSIRLMRQDSYAMTRAYGQFVAAVERFTRRYRRPSETPREYYLAVRDLLGDARPRAESLTTAFESAFYGFPNGPQAEALALGVAEFKSTLRSLKRPTVSGHNTEAEPDSSA